MKHIVLLPFWLCWAGWAAAGHLQLTVEGPNQLMSASFKVKSSQPQSEVYLTAKLASIPAFHVQTKCLSEIVYLTWIIEAQERRLVWHSSEAIQAHRRHGQYELKIPLQMANGSYEVYLLGITRSLATTTGVEMPKEMRLGSGRVSLEGSGVIPYGSDTPLKGMLANALVNLIKVGDNADTVRILEVKKPTTFQLYALGEGSRRAGRLSDFAWIEDLTRKTKVWKMDLRGTIHAGGSSKNLVSRQQLLLLPGQYAIHYQTNESHSYATWTDYPPHDPYFWGITLWPMGEGNNAVSVERQHRLKPILEIKRVGNNQKKEVGLVLSKPIGVRVFCLGEGTWNLGMVDYGWIVNSLTDEIVWKMDLRETVHAGGSEKNRMANEILQLPAGHYQICYQTDDSHAFGSWNALPPLKEDHWGIALLPLERGEASYATTAQSSQPSRKVLAELIRMESNSYREQSFILKKRSKLQILAFGEAVDNEFHDQGWIENNESGKKVWKMAYNRSAPAGGALKNRKINQEIILPAGEYTVMYETDDSHAFNDWNDAPPTMPETYGIQVFLVETVDF